MCKPRGFSPSGVMQAIPNSFSNELWMHLWNLICQGSSLETQPKVLLGAGHIRHLLPGISPGSRLPRGKQVEQTPHCLDRQCRHSEPVLRMLGPLLKSRLSGTSRDQPCQQASLGIAVSVQLCLLFVLHKLLACILVSVLLDILLLGIVERQQLSTMKVILMKTK